MTGPEHYREAERLTNHAVTIFDGDDRQHAFALWEIQQAQVHATLALAAATMDQHNRTDSVTGAWVGALS